MEFRYTPEEAQSVALNLLPYLKAERLSVEVEVAIGDEAPFATTLLAKGAGTFVAIECQGKPEYIDSLRELVGWLAVNRFDAEVFIAGPATAEIPLRTLSELKAAGVGLLIIHESGLVELAQSARNPAMMVTVDPSLALGRLRAEVLGIERKYNQGDRKGQVRELCDVIERETAAVARRAAEKNWINRSGAEVEAMNWASRINLLAAASVMIAGRPPLFDDTLKDDMHSFRGARNLVDHAAPNRREELRRQRQFPERIMMGARLAADLLAIGRRIR